MIWSGRARYDATEFSIEFTAKGELAELIREAAWRRKTTPAEIVADVLQTVFEQRLVMAVLDDA